MLCHGRADGVGRCGESGILSTATRRGGGVSPNGYGPVVHASKALRACLACGSWRAWKSGVCRTGGCRHLWRLTFRDRSWRREEEPFSQDLSKGAIWPAAVAALNCRLSITNCRQLRNCGHRCADNPCTRTLKRLCRRGNNVNPGAGVTEKSQIICRTLLSLQLSLYRK